MKARILVIEDEENIRKNLVQLLSSSEYEVDSVITAEAALKTISSKLPDLILCDINLPKMNGYDLKDELNQNKDTFNIPFIYLTARDTYQDLRNGMKLAADDYIFKPYKAIDILESIELRLVKQKSNYKKEKDEFIFVKNGKVIKKIRLSNINAICGENQYSRMLLITGKEYLIRRALSKWEEMLPKEMFVRVSRSAIISKENIEAIEKSESCQFVKLKASTEKIKVTNTELLKDLGI